MNTKKASAIGIIALAVVGVSASLGFHKFQQNKKLSAFQALVKQGSGQAESILGMISADSMQMPEIKPECKRFVEESRHLIERGEASDMSDANELKDRYISLLTAEDDLMMGVGSAQDFSWRELDRVVGGHETNEEECSGARALEDENAAVPYQLLSVPHARVRPDGTGRERDV